MRQLILILFLLSFFTFIKPTDAQTLFPENAQSGESIVTAQVGKFYLHITGFQSPNASVVIETLDGIFLASTTADGNGYFTFSDVLITENFPGFCFTAVDFRRVGESKSCIEINEVVNADQTYNDIFLPPTIGISKRIISAGESSELFGYSMPSAQVQMSMNDDLITLQAESDGYYEYLFEDVPAGTYTFSSRGVLGENTSLEPKNQVLLRAVTLQEQIRDDITGFVEELEERFPGLILLAPLILILLALLIALIWKTKPKFIYAFFDKFKKKHPMHHDYFLFTQ